MPKVLIAYLRPTGVPLFYSLLNPSPTRSMTSMDSHLVLTLDSTRDKDRLPKNTILIHLEVFLHSRTLVPYLFISDSDIFRDNLGLAEITSASRSRHVAPRLTRRRHLATCCYSENISPQLPPRFYYLDILR